MTFLIALLILVFPFAILAGALAGVAIYRAGARNIPPRVELSALVAKSDPKQNDKSEKPEEHWDNL